MKNEFSTFEIVKILNCNRNTLQSALAGDHIKMDIKRAKGPKERSKCSREGVYRINLFFKMLRCSIPRREAWSAIKEADITWNNVGFGEGQFRYLVRSDKTPPANLLRVWNWKIYKTLPKKDMAEDETMQWTIHIAAIKKEVDEGIERLD